jgi:hypothetical protein
MPRITGRSTTVAPSPRKPDAPKPAAFDKQDIRTWAAGASGAPSPAHLKSRGVRDAARPTLEAFRGTTNAQLVAALTSADQTRHTQLKTGKTKAAALVTPEDGTTRVKAMHMAALGADQTGLAFPAAIARIGKAEGFTVVLRVPSEDEKNLKALFAKEKLDNVTLVPIKDSQDLDFWSEDQGELHADGSVSVPRSLTGSSAMDGAELADVIIRGRMARLHPNANVVLSSAADAVKAREKYPDIAFSSVGAVGERGGQRAIAAVALGGKKELRVSNGYIEGGNALVGRRTDGTGFAVVGADSIAASQAALSKELKREVSLAETRSLIAQDYGVDTEQLVVVEQPGDFHIDMHVALLPGGKAVVNDPLAVFELQKKRLTEDLEKSAPKPPGPKASKRALEDYRYELSIHETDKGDLPERLAKLEREAKAAARAIERTIRDLEKGGVAVSRMPGVFPSSYPLERMNFMNAEQGRNAKGEHFAMLLGGDPRAEKVVAKALASTSDRPLRVHFLPRHLTATTLNAMGGISCRAKVEGVPG